MSELLSTIGPLAAFMLIPVWIPIISLVVGAVADAFRGEATTPAQEAVNAAKARTAGARRHADELAVGRRARDSAPTPVVPDASAAA